MQSGLGRPAAGARQVGADWRYGRAGVLLLGLTVSACVNTGQIANLTEAPRTTVAFEPVDGPPSAVFHKFVTSLQNEAGARQISVVAPSEAHYRLRGYLAAQEIDGTSSVVWVLDAYDAQQRRAFRLAGEEKTAARNGLAADDALLERIARAGIGQLAAFSASARPVASATAAVPAARQSSLAFGWLDDWTPEAAGIFRILRQSPSRPAAAADAGLQLPPPDDVPLPRGRPAPSDVSFGPALAFASGDR